MKMAFLEKTHKYILSIINKFKKISNIKYYYVDLC